MWCEISQHTDRKDTTQHETTQKTRKCERFCSFIILSVYNHNTFFHIYDANHVPLCDLPLQHFVPSVIFLHPHITCNIVLLSIKFHLYHTHTSLQPIRIIIRRYSSIISPPFSIVNYPFSIVHSLSSIHHRPTYPPPHDVHRRGTEVGVGTEGTQTPPPRAGGWGGRGWGGGRCDEWMRE